MDLLHTSHDYFRSRHLDASPFAVHCHGLLGVCYHEQGDYTESEDILTAVVANCRDSLGPDHEDTMFFMYHLGVLLYDLGRYSASEPLLTTLLENQRRTLGNTHKDTLRTMLKLSYLHNIQRKFTSTISLLSEYIECAKFSLGDRHKDVLNAKQNLANLYLLQWQYTEAEQLYSELLETFRAMYGDLHSSTLETMVSLGHIYLRQERLGDAEDIYLAAFQKATLLYGQALPLSGAATQQASPQSPQSPQIGVIHPLSEDDPHLSSYCHPLIKLYRGYYETALLMSLDHELTVKREEQQATMDKLVTEMATRTQQMSNNQKQEIYVKPYRRATHHRINKIVPVKALNTTNHTIGELNQSSHFCSMS
jgi:tetratricopeptide (TPR) repeat protein